MLDFIEPCSLDPCLKWPLDSEPNPHQTSHQVQIHITSGGQKFQKSGPSSSPALGQVTNAKEPKRTSGSFRVVNYPETVVPWFWIFPKYPELTCSFILIFQKIWNWWFFERKLNHPTLELKSSNHSRMGIYCWAYQLVLGCLFSKFLPAWYWYLNFSKTFIPACYRYWIFKKLSYPPGLNIRV